MTKAAPWRRSCSEVVKNRMLEALHATLYILHQTGPTGFLLKEDGASTKLKVCLGDTHECSCATYTKEKELCLHILWILLKKFRVSKDHEVVYQLGLVERDIDKVIHGHLVAKGSKLEGNEEGNEEAKPGVQIQREVLEGDVCPICQEELLGAHTSSITFCKFGCGKSIHLRCIRVWANHLKSTGETVIPCPLCRNNFGSLKELCSQRYSTKKVGRDSSKTRSLHLGVACSSCGACPIEGRCYRCTVCDSCCLCQSCGEEGTRHDGHQMEFRQHPNQPWRPARHPQPQAPTSFPPDLISSLHDRSLTADDYDLLLQLDRPQGDTQHVPERELCALPVRPLDSDSALILNRAQCLICSRLYTRGEWTKSLPCKHEFHRDCIDVWVRSGHPMCPIDGKPVITRKKKKLQRKEDGKPSSQGPMLTGWGVGDELGFSVSGQGLGASRHPLRPPGVGLAPSHPSAGVRLAPSHPSAGVRLAPSHPSAGVRLAPSAATSFCQARSGCEEATLSSKAFLQTHNVTGMLPRLDVAGQMLTSHPSPTVATTAALPKLPDSSHKVCTRRQFVESSRKLLQQRQVWCLGEEQEEELPQCCGHSLCKNPKLPSVPYTLPQGSKLQKIIRPRERQCVTEFCHQKLDTSLHVISYKTGPSPALTPTPS